MRFKFKPHTKLFIGFIFNVIGCLKNRLAVNAIKSKNKQTVQVH